MESGPHCSAVLFCGLIYNRPLRITSTVTVTVWLVLPFLPVMVMVRLPVVARLVVEMVSVEVPAPVIDDGLKVAVSPLPRPEAVSVMAELKPPVTALVIVTVPELPRSMVSEVGEALIEKPAVVPVTVSETVVVSTVLPEVPETVML